MLNLTQAQSARLKIVNRQIHNIVYGSHREIIEGVEIDFRHKCFDVEDWELPPALFKARELFSKGPKLLFPWTELSEVVYDRQYRSYPDSVTEDIAANNEFITEAGDKLSVRRIESMRNTGLLRGCNLERRHVYLTLRRQNGVIIQIERPIIMTPKNELWEENFAGNFYGTIKGRIERYFTLSDLASTEGIQSDYSFSYRALRKLKVLLHYHGINWQEVQYTSEAIVVLPTFSSEEYHDNSNVWLTINDAVALGYLWAKSEDERNWAPLGDNAVSQTSAAGRN